MKAEIAIEIVEIDWHPSLDVGIDDDWNFVVPEIASVCREKGRFYCIYGQHPVYGKDVLLYIGETKMTSPQRNVSKRLSEHFKGRFWDQTDLKVSIGVIERDLEDDKIIAVESILIAAHKPALNRKHLDQSMDSSKGILVQNFGFTRSLISECSGNYWCSS